MSFRGSVDSLNLYANTFKGRGIVFISFSKVSETQKKDKSTDSHLFPQLTSSPMTEANIYMDINNSLP